jgi:hypothetical protein
MCKFKRSNWRNISSKKKANNNAFAAGTKYRRTGRKKA